MHQPVDPSPSTPPLPDRVIAAVRTVAAATPGVAAAFVHADGAEFVLSGPVWTPELNLLAPTLAVDLQEQCAPLGYPMIEGSFFDGEPTFLGPWLRVYP